MKKFEHFMSPKGFDALHRRLYIEGLKGVLMFPPAAIGDCVEVKRAIKDMPEHYTRAMTVDIIEGSNTVSSPHTVRLRPTASWVCELNFTCPECEHVWDMIGGDNSTEFWERHSGLELCESQTDRSRDIEVTCPECQCEFRADLEY